MLLLAGEHFIDVFLGGLQIRIRVAGLFAFAHGTLRQPPRLSSFPDRAAALTNRDGPASVGGPSFLMNLIHSSSDRPVFCFQFGDPLHGHSDAGMHAIDRFFLNCCFHNTKCPTNFLVVAEFRQAKACRYDSTGAQSSRLLGEYDCKRGRLRSSH